MFVSVYSSSFFRQRIIINKLVKITIFIRTRTVKKPMKTRIYTQPTLLRSRCHSPKNLLYHRRDPLLDSLLERSVHALICLPYPTPESNSCISTQTSPRLYWLAFIFTRKFQLGNSCSQSLCGYKIIRIFEFAAFNVGI